MKLMKILSVLLVGFFFAFPCQGQVFPSMEFFFPQIADGEIDDEDEWRTILILNNPNEESTATGTLSIFSQDGSPLELRFRAFAGNDILEGEVLVAEDGVLPFVIPPEGLLQVITASLSEELVVAYGKVEADVEMSGMAIFGKFKVKEEEDKFEVEIESQAAVQATGTFTKFAVTDFRENKFQSETDEFEFEFESSTSTGLAVLNAGSEATVLTLTEVDAGGEEIGQVDIPLAAREQRAFFFEEVLEVPEDTVIASVIAESSGAEVSAVALKFDTELDRGQTIRNEFTVAPVIQLAPEMAP